MCCSVSPNVPVLFSNTILYASEVKKDSGEVVHVLGYQNKVQNDYLNESSTDSWLQDSLNKIKSFISAQGNAMILPFPCVPKTMSEENVLGTENCPKILQDIAKALEPVSASPQILSFGAQSVPTRSVQVFDTGIYTVVLAEDARDIPSALNRVPRQKRPALNPILFEVYARWYPEWTIALCCFDNREAKLAQPLLWWYKPMYEEKLFLPALDCHTGDVPDLNAKVLVDHTVAVSSYKWDGESLEEKRFAGVYYRDSIPVHIKPFLPDKVIGDIYQERMPNGDFTCDLNDVRQFQFKPVRNLPPNS